VSSADNPTNGEVRLWLSSSVLPAEGGVIAMCLIYPTDTEFGTGLSGRFEVADGAGWQFFGSLAASPARWKRPGPVWIGPRSGFVAAIGFSARGGEIGQAEYLTIPPP
jgi:hypothetical protein